VAILIALAFLRSLLSAPQERADGMFVVRSHLHPRVAQRTGSCHPVCASWNCNLT
jgi:hypothetical protein